MLPASSTSMASAAGTLGRPGMVMMSPVRATTKPAPAESFSWRTVTVKPSGAPRSLGLSEKEYWVLATHTGRLPQPISVRRFSSRAASGVSFTPAPPYTRVTISASFLRMG